MVEWKKIEDLGPYFGGLTGKTKEDFVDGNAKFITYMNVFSNPSLDVNTVGMVHINEGERQNKVQKGDILFSGSSETPDEAGMSCVVTDDLEGDYYMNSFCFGLRLNNPELYNLHYFKHVLRSYNIRQAISKTASGVTRFNISKARFGKVQIPVPSLEEQNRIVGILDTFTDSIENLKQQIAQRRKQYEHYRDQLLDLEGKDGVEMIPLGTVCSIFDGTHQTPKYTNSGIKFVSVENINNIYASTKYISELDFEEKYKNKPQKGDVLMTRIGDVGRCAIVDKNTPIAFYVSLSLLRPNDSISNKYIKYVLESRIGQKELRKHTLITAVPLKINIGEISKVKIPFISLDEQSRIVSILDTFEAYITNLEAQLAQRQKQYKYYRNQLLTFE
jgi:type I restriction enzyme S subunit